MWGELTIQGLEAEAADSPRLTVQVTLSEKFMLRQTLSVMFKRMDPNIH